MVLILLLFIYGIIINYTTTSSFSYVNIIDTAERNTSCTRHDVQNMYIMYKTCSVLTEYYL